MGRLAVCALLGAAVCGVPAGFASAAPTTAPSTAPTAAAHRSLQEIAGELTPAMQEANHILGNNVDLHDPAKRSELAPKAIPVLSKIVSLTQELGDTAIAEGKGSKEQVTQQLAGRRLQIEPMLIALGDAPSLERANTLAKSSDAFEAALGRGEILVAAHFTAANDQEQLKVVNDLETYLKEAGKNSASDFTAAIMLMKPPTSEAAVTALAKVVESNPPGPMTGQMLHQMNAAKVQKSFENKPIVLDGTLSDGKAFTSADWKGKVILVDFWATWCGPCVAELPHVKGIYKKYHDQGLEVLGVSNDFKQDALTAFLQKDTEMAWPSLFDAEAAGTRKWHPLTTKHGIMGIPTMFLIDRKGVLRTVEARQNMEEMIPKLLAEKAE